MLPINKSQHVLQRDSCHISVDNITKHSYRQGRYENVSLQEWEKNIQPYPWFVSTYWAKWLWTICREREIHTTNIKRETLYLNSIMLSSRIQVDRLELIFLFLLVFYVYETLTPPVILKSSLMSFHFGMNIIIAKICFGFPGVKFDQ